MPAEFLARMHVGQVHLDERNPAGGHGVPQGDAGMGEGRRIEQDEFNFLLHGLVYPLHQFVFRIALVEAEHMTRRLGNGHQAGIDFVETGMAVVLWLALTQEIQVGSVKYQYFRHRVLSCRYLQGKAVFLRRSARGLI
jgi:hypothetical protein